MGVLRRLAAVCGILRRPAASCGFQADPRRYVNKFVIFRENLFRVNSGLHRQFTAWPAGSGANELVTRSTRHIVKSCDELTIVSDGIVTS